MSTPPGPRVRHRLPGSPPSRVRGRSFYVKRREQQHAVKLMDEDIPALPCD
jgi:hypothetical protein